MATLNIENACSTSAGEPIGTTSLAAASCNLSHLDRIANSNDPTSTNRVGNAQQTVAGLAQAFGFIVQGTFVDGFTITNRNQLGQDASGDTWRYRGATLPFVVAPGTTPSLPDFEQVVFGTAGAVTYDTGTVEDALDELTARSDSSQFATLSAALNSSDVENGRSCYISERTLGNGGGAFWNIVLTSSVTPNGRNIVQSIATPTLSFSLNLPNSDPIAWGAVGDGVADDTAVIVAADAAGKIHIKRRFLMTASHEFTNKVLFGGGALVPQSLSVELDFTENSTLTAKNLGAMADGQIVGETVTGTNDYISIQSAIWSCARTNGRMTFKAGGGNYRCDTGLTNWIAGVGSCSMFGKGLLGFVLMTEADITMLWLGGSAQAVKRVYVQFANPGDALTNQIGVRFASDDFQWSQSVIEQVWVSNAHRSFVQNNESGTFGTIFLNTYRNLQSIFARDWGFRFDSKNGSTTLHFDTCYVRGNGTTSKGVFLRNIKEVITTNFAFDACVNNVSDIANVNLLNMKNTALESNIINDSSQVMMNLNATKVTVDGFTDLGTEVNVGAGNNARFIFAGANATSGVIVSGYVELSPVITSGNKFRIAWNSQTDVEVDASIERDQVLDGGFHSQLIKEGVRFTSTNNFPNYGSWTQGQKVYFSTPSAGGREGYTCTASGSPGTWNLFGNIDA